MRGRGVANEWLINVNTLHDDALPVMPFVSLPLSLLLAQLTSHERDLSPGEFCPGAKVVKLP